MSHHISLQEITLIHQDLTFDSRVFVFETVMRVRNTEIDSTQYVTLEALTAQLSEARARFLYSKGIKEMNAEYQGLLTDNLQLSVNGRVRAREELLFEVGVESLDDNGGQIAIKVTRMYDGSLVAQARMHFINYDYRLNRTVSMNELIKEALEPQPFEL